MGSPFGEWRAPTEDEWLERPFVTELVDHCHSKDFSGADCDIKRAKEGGNVCFCRTGRQPCGSQFCDLMYVKTAGM